MGVKLQTIKDIRLYLSEELEEIYHDSEIIAISNLIIKTVTGMSRLHQFQMADQQIKKLQAHKIEEICEELKTGKPIQYILGETEFYDCIIKVTGATLIPRPETEELVDLIIIENRGFTGNILDVGTGSGCIAIALAAKLPGTSIFGIDISGEAIKTARENAKLNNVNVSFLKGDIFNFKSGVIKNVEVIVSNPPYIRDSERQFMNKNVLDFEPHTALFVPDSDPLLFYRPILNVAEKIMLPGGKIYFEINEAMGQSMVYLLKGSGYTGIELVKDLNGKDRIVKGEKDV
jgi:release factor glutamine methyltransferase